MSHELQPPTARGPNLNELLPLAVTLILMAVVVLTCLAQKGYLNTGKKAKTKPASTYQGKLNPGPATTTVLNGTATSTTSSEPLISVSF